jgi:methylthioribose-1-phosphate isomerase
MESLEAIRFSRNGDTASLALLEQRLLPLQTQWIQIDGPKAAWNAIYDMTVRGAPAIGEPPPPLPPCNMLQQPWQ